MSSTFQCHELELFLRPPHFYKCSHQKVKLTVNYFISGFLQTVYRLTWSDDGMRSSLTLLLLLVTLTAKVYTRDENCQNRILFNTTAPSRLNFEILPIAENVATNINNANLSNIARDLFETNKKIFGLLVSSKKEHALALSVSKRLKIFKNFTKETTYFWTLLNVTRNGWGRAFQECEFLRTWMYAYLYKTEEISVGLFLELKLDRCDRGQDEIFNNSGRCDEETMVVSQYCIWSKWKTRGKHNTSIFLPSWCDHIL